MSGNSIKSIMKACRVIDLLAASPKALSLGELAKETGLAKSTLHGILSTLVDSGYVQQMSENGHYQLSVRLFEIGSSISNKWNERQVASPYMQRILEQTGETVHMAVLSDGQVLYINKQESSRSIQIVTANGVKLPAHCTGVGKVLLSGLTDAEVRHICKKHGMPRFTQTTRTDLHALMVELEDIRAKGYATDEQEFMDGLCCIAVPIFNHDGQVTAALSISGPLSRMKGEDFIFNRNCLLTASQAISEELGYHKKRCKGAA